MLRAIGDYVNAHSIPPLDRGLRSIVAQQVANLLRGGWPIEEIKATALELLAQYDRFAGHRAMTQLQRTLEVADEDRQEAAHRAQKHAPLSPDAMKAMGFDAGRRRLERPEAHEFTKSAEPNTCEICRGPLGVHVRRKVVA